MIGSSHWCNSRAGNWKFLTGGELHPNWGERDQQCHRRVIYEFYPKNGKGCFRQFFSSSTPFPYACWYASNSNMHKISSLYWIEGNIGWALNNPNIILKLKHIAHRTRLQSKTCIYQKNISKRQIMIYKKNLNRLDIWGEWYLKNNFYTQLGWHFLYKFYIS